jgi:hypothetical protein
MSLINDAIKRANQANKDRQAPGNPAAPSPAEMQSVDTPRSQPAGGSLTSMLLIAGIVVFVLLGGSLLFLSLSGDRSSGGASTESVVSEMEPPVPVPTPVTQPDESLAVMPVPAESLVADALQNPVPAPSTTAPVDAASAATSPAPPTIAPGPVAQPAGPRPFPELKLQGIYYRLRDPSVMINGQTLEIGDLVEDARVIRIERKEVTLELDGQQKVLRLQ